MTRLCATLCAAFLGATAIGACADEADSQTPADPDLRPVSCESAPRPLITAADATCDAPEATFLENTDRTHYPDDVPITYDVEPPSSGPHRAAWARWGAYDFLPAERYLHNLEHGGFAVLYDPCLDDASVASLRAWLNERPADDSGPFRWVLSPWPGLGHSVTVLAWEHTLTLDCWRDSDIAAVLDFFEANYRNAPEDVPFDGNWSVGWLGR